MLKMNVLLVFLVSGCPGMEFAGADRGTATVGDAVASAPYDAGVEDVVGASDGALSDVVSDRETVADRAADVRVPADRQGVEVAARDSWAAVDRGPGERPMSDTQAQDVLPAADVHLDAGMIDDASLAQARVEIRIDNFCNLSVVPEAFVVPVGQTLQLSYINLSVDYFADIWSSYIGGFLGLEYLETWEDSFEYCTGNSQYSAYVDITLHEIGLNDQHCPGHRLVIECQ